VQYLVSGAVIAPVFIFIGWENQQVAKNDAYSKNC